MAEHQKVEHAGHRAKQRRQPHIEQGQRVEAFRLEACTEGACREIARATTIGYKRILRFAPARAERVRLVVEQARGTPVLAGFSLHTLAP